MGILGYLSKSRRRVLRPGSRGGRYWIDQQGNIRYDEQPVTQAQTKPVTPEGKLKSSWSSAALSELEAANPEAAKRLVTRDNILGKKLDKGAYDARGVSAGAAYLIDRIYRRCIAPKPKAIINPLTGKPYEWPATTFSSVSIREFVPNETPEGRKRYVEMIHELSRFLEPCRTVDDIIRVMASLRQLYIMEGGALVSDEQIQNFMERQKDLGTLGKGIWEILLEGHKEWDKWVWNALYFEELGDWDWPADRVPEQREPLGHEYDVKFDVERTRVTRPVQAIGELKEKFGINDVEVTGAVEPDMLEYHVRRTGEALDDLALVLGIPRYYIGWNERLRLMFGTQAEIGNDDRYSTAAYYSSEGQRIYITEQGTGSIAHEWAHFFDYILADVTKGTVQDNKRAASEGYISDAGGAMSNVYLAWQKLIRTMASVDPKAPFYEANLTYSTKPTNYLQEAQREKSPYWRNPKELFARAFEAWIADELKERGLESTFLVGRSVRHNKLYPSGWERSEINKAFQEFFEVVKNENVLEKALKAMASEHRNALAQVQEVMRENYPDIDRRWPHAFEWTRQRVALDRIDGARRPQARNMEKVNRIIGAIEAETEMPPLVVLNEDPDGKLSLVDGYHRWLAYKRLGRKYCDVLLGEPAWREIYRSQAGEDPIVELYKALVYAEDEQL